MSTGVHTENTDSLQDSSDDEDLSSTTGNNGSNGTGPGSNTGTPGVGGIVGSQMDSYDWVENSNNKKKRKIPSPANPGAVLGSSGGGGGCNVNVGAQSSGFSPNGPNTTPRSRWKPSGCTQRSPLGISSIHSAVRRTPRRYPASPLDSRRANGTSRLFPQSGSDDTQSTASSQNENSLYTIDKGLHQSQFTFEHMTPASTSLARQTNFSPGSSYPKTMSTVGTQTSPSISATNAYPPTPTPQKKKGSGKAKQAQQRQRRQGGLYGVPGNPNGEIWICEFCEYESIFGERPEALMRQYDIKERRERRRLREKQRLLEKAKQKGKKNQGKSKKNIPTSTTGSSPSPVGSADYQEPLSSTTVTSTPKTSRNNQHVQTDTEVGSSLHVSAGRGAGGTGGVGGGGGKAAVSGVQVGGGNGGGSNGAVA